MGSFKIILEEALSILASVVQQTNGFVKKYCTMTQEMQLKLFVALGICGAAIYCEFLVIDSDYRAVHLDVLGYRAAGSFSFSKYEVIRSSFPS
jgi:hypothetical protein